MQRPCGVKELGESEELNISNRGILEMGTERQQVVRGAGGRQMPEDSFSHTECVRFKCTRKPLMGLKIGQWRDLPHLFKRSPCTLYRWTGEGT